MALNDLEDRLESAIRHINTALDIDPWAQKLAVESMRMRIALMKGGQPEIIRCRDCTYWMPHVQLGYDEDNEEYHDYCARLIPDDEFYAFTRDADDFCSRGVRRTDDDRNG